MDLQTTPQRPHRRFFSAKATTKPSSTAPNEITYLVIISMMLPSAIGTQSVTISLLSVQAPAQYAVL